MNIIKVIFIAICAILLCIVAYWILLPDEAPYWTGFGSSKIDSNYRPSKNLWDWLELILIPVILGSVGWYLGNLEKKSEQNSIQERYQNENIHRYLDLMTNLLLKEELKSDPKNGIIKTIARTHSIRLLRESDNNRKAIILQFLYESELIGLNPLVDLNGADIQFANLEGIVLKDVSIKGAYFLHSNLKNSKLNGSDFSGSNFSYADLSSSNFDRTNLTYANFIGAKVMNCDLRSANLDGTDFSDANLLGTKITEAQSNMIIKKNVINFKTTD